jgi:phospholipid transport system substrate-binding protein
MVRKAGSGGPTGPGGVPHAAEDHRRVVKFPAVAAGILLGGLVFVCAAPSSPRAESAAPAPAAVIDALDQTLVGVMKDALKLGYQGRYAALEPIIERTFNIKLMTQLVVGPAWAGWTQGQRDQVSDAFRRFITATYARRFDGYSGEDFVIDGERESPNGTVVTTRLIRPSDPAITINYLIRDNGEGAARVVDVYLTGTISELATRRSEFSAVLEHDGFAGLLAALDKKAGSPPVP